MKIFHYDNCGNGVKPLHLSEYTNLHHAMHDDVKQIDENVYFHKNWMKMNQVKQLSTISTQGGRVLCFGIRTDFQRNVFKGSSMLLGIADKLKQMEGMCFCGNTATMNARLNKKKRYCGMRTDR